MLLGSDCAAITEGRTIGVQALSGTGALRIGAEFLARVTAFTDVYYSDPTWGNHKLVFKEAGFTKLTSYRYWDPLHKCLHFQGTMEDIEIDTCTLLYCIVLYYTVLYLTILYCTVLYYSVF